MGCSASTAKGGPPPDAASVIQRAIGDVLDLTVEHDLVDMIVLDAPCAPPAVAGLVAIASTGGKIGLSIPETFAEGYPRLSLLSWTYATNEFFSGGPSAAKEIAAALKRDGMPSAEQLEKQTRSKGLIGVLLDGTATVLTSDGVIGTSEAFQLRLYIAPDAPPIVLSQTIDDALYRLIADVLYFNGYAALSFDSDVKVSRDDTNTLTVGIEFGGMLGFAERTGDVLHVDAADARPAVPLDAELLPAPSVQSGAAADDDSFELAARLANPKRRYARDGNIVGLGVVETLGSAPVSIIPEGRWRWSEKLLAAGSVNWDTDGSSPVQDALNRFRESADQSKVVVAYCAHTKERFHPIVDESHA